MTILLQTQDQASVAPSLVIDDRQMCRQTAQFLYLGGVLHESADRLLEIERRIRFISACLQRMDPESYEMATSSRRLNVRMLKGEVIDTRLDVCVT